MRMMEVEVKQSKVDADSHTISSLMLNVFSVKLIMVIVTKNNLFHIPHRKKIKRVSVGRSKENMNLVILEIKFLLKRASDKSMVILDLCVKIYCCYLCFLNLQEKLL